VRDPCLEHRRDVGPAQDGVPVVGDVERGDEHARALAAVEHTLAGELADRLP